MRRSAVGARLFEASLFAIASALLFSLGPLAVLFLLPIQVSVSRRGLDGLLAAPLAVVFLAAVEALRLAGGSWGGPVAMESGLKLAAAGLLVAGLVTANLVPARATVRLLAGAVVAAAGVAGVGAAVAHSQVFAALVDAKLGQAAETFREFSKLYGGDTVASSLAAPLADAQQLRGVAASLLPLLERSFVADLFAFLAFSWWAGRAAASRGMAAGAAAGGTGMAAGAAAGGPVLAGDRPSRFADFRLEAWWLWPLIGSLALVGAELVLGGSAGLPPQWRFVSYAAWNAAWIMLFLFGLQALAIVRFWIEQRGLPRFLWLALIALLGLAFASPQLNLAVSLALPLFGASENWVRYRVRREAPDPEKE
jgi:hypothetical protein